MSAVERFLPALRRLAYVLTNSNAKAEGLVTAALAELRDIAEDPDLLRKTLFRRVCAHFLTAGWNADSSRGDTHSEVADRTRDHVGAIPARARIAFLLRALEKFTDAEIGFVLRCLPGDARTLLDEAEAQIRAQLVTRVLIIEDELLIAQELSQLVSELGHEPVGVARTRHAALEMVREREPGIILADVHLADGSSGLEAVNDILEDLSVPIVFITAHADRLLTAERPEAAFVISKPFAKDGVRAVINQALFFDRAAKPVRVGAV